MLDFVLLVDAAVDNTNVVDGCLVDFTERWIDCLLLLLAIEEAEEEEVAVVLQFVVLVDDKAADLDLVESSQIPAIISLLLFFDLYCRVDLLDRLVVVVATISVDVIVL